LLGYYYNNPLNYNYPTGWTAIPDSRYDISNGRETAKNNSSRYYDQPQTDIGLSSGQAWSVWNITPHIAAYKQYQYYYVGDGKYQNGLGETVSFDVVYQNAIAPNAKIIPGNEVAQELKEETEAMADINGLMSQDFEVIGRIVNNGLGSYGFGLYVKENGETTGGLFRIFYGQASSGGVNNLGNYTDAANNTAYGIVLGSNLYGESARGLTTTTSTIAREVQAANVLGKIATVAKWTGYLGNTISIAANTVNVYNDPTAANYARAAVNGFAVGLNLVNLVVPGLGTGLSLIVSTADMMGGFNWLYNSLETSKNP